MRSRVDSASATGSLPDVFGAVSLALVHSLATDGITDTDAAADVIDALGPETFSERGLNLWSRTASRSLSRVTAGLSYCSTARISSTRPDLAPPTTFEAIRTAALTLTGGGRVGIVAGTNAGESFTQQSFEHLALANGCQLVDAERQHHARQRIVRGHVRLLCRPHPQCFGPGEQDADSTRAAYLAGDAAMVDLVIVHPRRAGGSPRRCAADMSGMPPRHLVSEQEQRHRNGHRRTRRGGAVPVRRSHVLRDRERLEDGRSQEVRRVHDE